MSYHQASIDMLADEFKGSPYIRVLVCHSANVSKPVLFRSGLREAVKPEKAELCEQYWD